MINVAINGYGRIGRNILRAVFDAKREKEFNIVAVNDLGDISIDAHLTKYDSVHGVFNADVSHDNESICVNGHKIHFFSERDPAKLPWTKLNVDLVVECTGHFTTKEKAKAHLQAGAKKVLISAPGKEVDATIVYGVNHDILTDDHVVISNASCTTNCLAPLAKVLNDSIGIESGLMTTIHAYTNDQVLTDAHHSDPRRARAAALSMIPTKTGAAAAVGLVLPELNGKLDGFAVRVPTANVSVVDLTFTAKRDTTIDEVNQIVKNAVETDMKGVISYNDAPLVSIDFNGHAASSAFDATQTKVMAPRLVKVFSWYDNEWGFSNRMIDTAMAWFSQSV